MTALADVPPASTFGTERRLLAAAMDLQATLACRVNDLAACISHHDACAAGQLFSLTSPQSATSRCRASEPVPWGFL